VRAQLAQCVGSRRGKSNGESREAEKGGSAMADRRDAKGRKEKGRKVHGARVFNYKTNRRVGCGLRAAIVADFIIHSGT
jgi:hypothetical protein